MEEVISHQYVIIYNNSSLKKILIAIYFYPTVAGYQDINDLISPKTFMMMIFIYVTIALHKWYRIYTDSHKCL